MATARYRGPEHGDRESAAMLWIRRRYCTGTWAKWAIFDQVERHFIALNAPPSMLMIEHYHDPLGHPSRPPSGYVCRTKRKLPYIPVSRRRPRIKFRARLHS